jgi:hypothetical protein
MQGRRFNVDSLEELQQIAQRFIAAHKDNDVETQRSILRQLVEDEQSIYEEKQRLLAELKTLRQEARIAGRPEERTARLITLFKFAADLKAVGHDELADEETTEAGEQVTKDTFQELKSIGPQGLNAVVNLLDDPNPNIRCSAGLLLMPEMPERAVPVLEELRDQHDASDAAIRALVALPSRRSR